MSKSTLALKATVTRRKAESVPSDMEERLEQLRHHQAAITASTTDLKARQAEQGAATATTELKSGKQVKREVRALQQQFLAANLNRVVHVFMLNGVKLAGRIREYDQFTLLLQGADGIDSLVFKHAINTIVPDSR